MAVRIFDLTEPQSSRLTVVEAAPRSRRDLRRSRRRWGVVAVASVSVPFVVALFVLGVAH